MRKRDLWGLGVVVLALLAGCNAEDTSNITQDVNKIAKDTSHVAGNASVSARAYGVLSQLKDVNVNGLHIEAKDGVVTISGHVRSATEKRKVLETLNDIRGVDHVVNQIRLQP